MKITKIALALMSLCTLQALGNSVIIKNNTPYLYNAVVVAPTWQSDITAIPPYSSATIEKGANCLQSIYFTQESTVPVNFITQRPSGTGCGSWLVNINGVNQVDML